MSTVTASYLDEQPTHVRLGKWARHLGFKQVIDANNLQEVCQMEKQIWEDIMRKICPNVNHIRQNILLKKLSNNQLQGVTHVNKNKDTQCKERFKLEKRLVEIEDNIQDDEKIYDDLQQKVKCSNTNIQHKKITLSEMAFKVELLQEKEWSVKRKIDDLKSFLESTQHYIEPKLKLDGAVFLDSHMAPYDCQENYMHIHKMHGGDTQGNLAETYACPMFLEERSGFAVETVWNSITDLQEKLINDVEASTKSAEVTKYCSLQLPTSSVNDINVRLKETMVVVLDIRKKKAQKLEEYVREKEQCKEAYKGYLRRNPPSTGQPLEADKFLELAETTMRSSLRQTYAASVKKEIERLTAETEALGDPKSAVLALKQQKDQLFQNIMECETDVVRCLNAQHQSSSNLLRMELEVKQLLEPMELPHKGVVEKLKGSLMKNVQQLLGCPLKALSKTHLSSGKTVPTYQMLTEYRSALVCKGLSPRTLEMGFYPSPEMLLMTTIINKLYLNQLHQLECESLPVPSLDMVTSSKEMDISPSFFMTMLNKLEKKSRVAEDLMQFWWNQPLQHTVRESLLVSGKNLKAYQDLYSMKVQQQLLLPVEVHSVTKSSYSS